MSKDFDEDLMADLMTLDPFMIDTSLGREWAVLSVRGELDILTAPDLSNVLAALAHRGRNQIVVDVTAVRFVDARGLAVLAECARSLLDRGSFVVACPSPSFRRLLEITGLDSVVPTSSVPPTITGYNLPLRF